VTDGRKIKQGGRQVTYREANVRTRTVIEKHALERALFAYEEMWMKELGFPTEEKGI
jgi:hypothetical protein